MTEITPEMRRHCLDHSTERRVSKNFPEYVRFLTGAVEYRKAKIINGCPVQVIDVLEECKQGDLGDIIETYVKLMAEDKAEKTFWGSLKLNIFGIGKRTPWDREYIMSDLKRALNNINVRW